MKSSEIPLLISNKLQSFKQIKQKAPEILHFHFLLSCSIASVTSYLSENETENLQNGDVYLAQIPDFEMEYLENHLAIEAGDGWGFFCICHALSFGLNFFSTGVSLEAMFNRSKRNICIIDDLMQSASGSQLVENLFTNGRHLNVSVVFISQNLFYTGKK